MYPLTHLHYHPRLLLMSCRIRGMFSTHKHQPQIIMTGFVTTTNVFFLKVTHTHTLSFSLSWKQLSLMQFMDRASVLKLSINADVCIIIHFISPYKQGPFGKCRV